MTAFRLLNPQGFAGLAASVVLALLLVTAKIDARHWRKQSAHFEALFRDEAKAHAATVADVRAATEAARAADAANAERIVAAQTQIDERTLDDLHSRLADARARFAALAAERVRREASQAATVAGGGRDPALPGLSAAARGVDQAAGENRLPDPDRLIATEQAIQLDELIQWVRAQAAIPR